ncbi:MAG: hypothetical protein Q8P49_02480 [Candidatus Liptonbacteria bacterium]|nr:hypothetical protein [Candidatus Liptonbacteria bacterium]
MADQNSWNTRGESEAPFEAAPSVPPPPPEVRVRTMKSDIESMMRGGGGQPQFRNVAAPMISGTEEGVSTGNDQNEKPKSAWTVVIIVIAVGLLAAISYLAYQLLFAEKSGPTPVPFPIAPAAPPPQSILPPPSGVASFVHKSFFKDPADALLTLTIQTTAQNAGELQTFGQNLVNLISAANPKGDLFEINVKDGEGNDLRAADIMKAEDAAVIDPQFFADHFVPDTTFFVYKDRNGLWPGYVLGLQPKDNWLFVKNDVAKLETSPKLENFFLVSPGTPSLGGFKDMIEAGQPARILRFTSATTSSSFVYGFFHNYLVLSTSEDGLMATIGRL